MDIGHFNSPQITPSLIGTGDRKSVPTPKEMNSQYSTIWREVSRLNSRAKSARK